MGQTPELVALYENTRGPDDSSMYTSRLGGLGLEVTVPPQAPGPCARRMKLGERRKFIFQMPHDDLGCIVRWIIEIDVVVFREIE